MAAVVKSKKTKKKKTKAKQGSLWGFFLSIPGMALIVAALLLATDIYTKYWVHFNLPRATHETQWYPYNGIGVFENFFGIEFAIVHVTNRGAAWGILSDFQIYLVALRIIFILGLVVFLLFYNKNKFLLIPLTMVVVGAIGNICDYFFYGHVIDMLRFVFWGYDYPAFNVADAAISVGIVSAVLISFRQHKQMLYEV